LSQAFGLENWAPTGGYLRRGCFATGTRAARGALRRMRGQERVL